ncbi:hypothetical protein HAX54_005311 [Datura stramonium]|uniref:Uncharacterized protein n=1 Tax=Datura stramonium TaxID=4076 RepID=A0ABS8RU38_DATST|nr:hypothetical protein [Datura stramonium]
MGEHCVRGHRITMSEKGEVTVKPNLQVSGTEEREGKTSSNVHSVDIEEDEGLGLLIKRNTWRKLEALTRMTNTPSPEEHNPTKEIVVPAMQQIKEQDGTEKITTSGENYEISERGGDYQVKTSSGQMIVFYEPLPIQIQDRLSKRAIEDKATL